MQRDAGVLIREISAKRAIRKEIRIAKKLLSEYRYGGDDSDWLEPFRDVLQALRLFAMDLSNSLRLIIQSVFTFDVKEMQKKALQFDDRRQKINNEWKPIMDRADATLGGIDPVTRMAIMGPGLYFASEGIGPALTAGKTVAEIVTATKWDQLVGSYTEELSLDQQIARLYQSYQRNEDEKDADRKSLLQRLSGIFSENFDHTENVLIEQKVSASPGQKLQISEKEAIEMFVKVTGMDKAFAKLRKQHMANLKFAITDTLNMIEPARATSQLFAAKNLKEFEKAFNSARQQNPKLNPDTYKKLEKTVNDESEKLLKDPKYVEQNSVQKGKQLSPDELKELTYARVYEQAKSQFDKQTADGLKNVVNSGQVAIKNLKIDDLTLAEMKKSKYPEVKEVLDIYNQLLKTYNEIKNDYEMKVKSRVK